MSPENDHLAQPTEDKNKTPVFDAAAIFTGAENQAVKIKIPGSTEYGTGFFVTSGEPHSCEVATLSHVTDGKQQVSAITVDGQTLVAELEKVDWKNEIAIYQLKNVRDPIRVCQEVQITTRLPQDHEPLVGVGIAAGDFAGAPLARPFSAQALGFTKRKDLNLKALPNEDKDRDVLVLGGEAGQHGYSGAALYESQSKVVAIEAGPGPDGTMVAEFAKHLQDNLDQIKAEREARAGTSGHKVP